MATTSEAMPNVDTSLREQKEIADIYKKLREAEAKLIGPDGKTEILRIYHLDRGYDRLDKKLRALGADIRRAKGGA